VRAFGFEPSFRRLCNASNTSSASLAVVFNSATRLAKASSCAIDSGNGNTFFTPASPPFARTRAPTDLGHEIDLDTARSAAVARCDDSVRAFDVRRNASRKSVADRNVAVTVVVASSSSRASDDDDDDDDDDAVARARPRASLHTRDRDASTR
jgi:hypothetical protein